MSVVSPALAAFLGEPLLAVVGTKRGNGGVALNPVWFEYRQDALWLNSYETAAWPKHVQRAGGAVLLLIDPADPLRVVQLECDLVATEREGARPHIDALSIRYLGHPYTGPHEDRLIMRLRPTRARSSL